MSVLETLGKDDGRRSEGVTAIYKFTLVVTKKNCFKLLFGMLNENSFLESA